MALIHCPECNHEVSDTAKKCPNCGYKIIKQINPIVLKRIKTISLIVLIAGILLFVIGMGWSISTADKGLQLKSGYYFGTTVTKAEWLAYQKIVSIQNLLCNTGVVFFIVGLVSKIIVWIKYRK